MLAPATSEVEVETASPEEAADAIINHLKDEVRDINPDDEELTPALEKAKDALSALLPMVSELLKGERTTMTLLLTDIEDKRSKATEEAAAAHKLKEARAHDLRDS